MAKRDDDPDYEVGYGRPPKASRFKKGQSGNPKGRPAGAKGLRASIDRELETRIVVREGGREIKVSKAQAAAMRLVANALGGEMKALTLLMNLDASQAGAPGSTMPSGEPAPPEPVDYEILRHFFKMLDAEIEDAEDQEAGDDEA